MLVCGHSGARYTGQVKNSVNNFGCLEWNLGRVLKHFGANTPTSDKAFPEVVASLMSRVAFMRLLGVTFDQALLEAASVFP